MCISDTWGASKWYRHTCRRLVPLLPVEIDFVDFFCGQVKCIWNGSVISSHNSPQQSFPPFVFHVTSVHWTFLLAFETSGHHMHSQKLTTVHACQHWITVSWTLTNVFHASTVCWPIWSEQSLPYAEYCMWCSHKHPETFHCVCVYCTYGVEKNTYSYT